MKLQAFLPSALDGGVVNNYFHCPAVLLLEKQRRVSAGQEIGRRRWRGLPVHLDTY
jgi:hypothetical protein